MKLHLTGIGLAAALQAALAWPQAAPHAHHLATEAKPAPRQPAAAAPSQPPAAGAALYRSPFDGYRSFTPDEPLKDWRLANEEVRKAGGHAGIMNAVPAGEAPKEGKR